MKIGIITMHKVLNFGSALQAFALQKYIEDNISEDVCLIDYDYPNKEHKKFIKSKQSLSLKIRLFLVQIIGSFLKNRRKRQVRYDFFYNKYFRLSDVRYQSHDDINMNPPLCDVYITGSDQVWNVNTMNNDGAFYLDFAPAGSIKISFGASFSTSSVPERFVEQIKTYLSSYSMIGLREASGVNLVKSLGLNQNIQIFNTCDPTLLLTKKDYDIIANDSNIRIEGDYILVYYLAYYNSEPALSDVIRKAVEKYKCKVMLIGYRFIPYKGEYQYINGIGPAEFLWLYNHATFVVSCSFHGTIFSIINRKPFYTIVPPGGNDNRSKDLLHAVKMDQRAILSTADNEFLSFENPYTEEVESAISEYIGSSKNFLEKIKTIVV